ncbi:hypothetical protein AD938_08060, partial [Gluconobacter japonicus]
MSASDVTSVSAQTEEAPVPLPSSAPGASPAVETETKSPYLAISPVPVVEGGHQTEYFPWHNPKAGHATDQSQ